MSNISNFPILTHTSGNTIQPSDLDTTFAAIRGVLDQLIENNNRTPLVPVGFAGQVQIPNIDLRNTILCFDSSGNISVIPKQFFDDAAALAVTSATNAAASYNASLVMGSLLPAQAGNAGLGLTTDGNVTSWGASVPETLSILNFVGYFQ